MRNVAYQMATVPLTLKFASAVWCLSKSYTSENIAHIVHDMYEHKSESIHLAQFELVHQN